MLRKLPTKTLSADQTLDAVRAHFDEHGAALCNAAGLIDGEAGTARVLRLMSELREASRLDRVARRRLVDLHRLLSVDPVIDEFEPDLSSWILLEPDSAEVEELCLLTDRLMSGMRWHLHSRCRTRPELRRRPCAVCTVGVMLRDERKAQHPDRAPSAAARPRNRKILTPSRFPLRHPDERPMFSSPAPETSLRNQPKGPCQRPSISPRRNMTPMNQAPSTVSATA